MHSLARRGFVTTLAGGFALLLAPRIASAETLTITKGTTVDLAIESALDSNTAKVGDTFRAKLVQPLYAEGQMVAPADTIVNGRVESVNSVRSGARSGTIGIKFVSMELPGEVKDIDAKLISLRMQDKDKHVPVVAAAPTSTGRHTDVVLIGQSSPADVRAHTLVGDGAADDYSHTSLSEGEVVVSSVTVISMEFADALKVTSLQKR